MTRPRRYAELVHDAADGPRPPIVPGCWVVVADPDNSKPLQLARVVDGPTYVHRDGHAIGEVWTLHDGDPRERHHLELTAIDLGGVLDEGRQVLADLRAGRQGDVCRLAALRVHRAACLARRLSTLWRADATIAALLALDEMISHTEDALRDLVRVQLPRVARILYLVGLCELARDPAWQSGDPAHPHPRLKEMT